MKSARTAVTLVTAAVAIAILREAQALLADSLRFSPRCSAQDDQGKPVHPCDPTAVRWCGYGAIGKSAAYLQLPRVAQLHVFVDGAARLLYGEALSLVAMRPDGHEAVLAIYAAALEALATCGPLDPILGEAA